MIGDLTPDETEEEGRRGQDLAAAGAAYAACNHLGLRPGTSEKGALVEEVAPGGPCDGRLRAGDVVPGVDGNDASTVEELFKAVVRQEGRPVGFRVRRALRDGAGPVGEMVDVAPGRVEGG